MSDSDDEKIALFPGMTERLDASTAELKSKISTIDRTMQALRWWPRIAVGMFLFGYGMGLLFGWWLL